ncbi:hypothetical protein FKP32DRAFT_1591588 [Trametes sanguinea]|nr:hypothetical protein FKP32DRAFT_1591588 [Trametes sanguinea]
MATPNPPKIMTTQVPNGTPMPDRAYRNDYPPSATSSPATVRSVASFSTPQPPSHLNQSTSSQSSSNPAVPTNQLLTLDGLLAAHANSSNPPLAALEAAVGERNSLSAQNTQLWKLIEKQRSGYNHILKELERMRGERDLYRGRLQQAGENTDALLRAHRAKEKSESKDGGLRSASSHSQLNSDETRQSGFPFHSVAGPHSSHGASIAASRLHQLSASRSFDPSQSNSTPRTPERKGSQGTLQLPRSDSPALPNSGSNNYLSASSQASSSQSSLAAATSSPLSGGEKAADTTTRGPTEDKWPQQPQFQPSVVPARSDSLSVTSTPTPSPSTSTQSVKPSLSRETTEPAANSPRAEGPQRAGLQGPNSQEHSQSSVVLTPASPERIMNPPINGRGHAVPPLDGSSRSPNAPSTNDQRTSHPRPPPISPPPAGQPVSITVNGDANLSVRPSAPSRDSQISLPEEAKRYYATMASPAVSPGMKFNFPSAPSSPLKQESSYVEQGLASQQRPPYAAVDDSNGQVSGTHGTLPAGVGLGIPGEATSLNASSSQPAPSSARGGRNGAESHRAGSVTDGAEEGADRPSMSTSDSHGNQSSSLAPSQNSVSDQPPASPFPLPLPQGPPRMGFRALPLLAEDLPYTEIVVASSTIRPNERGKDVLSFIISVDPGRGKEPWKVEKLYSDVLGLDTRVRAAVGRSAAKKLASLPEGRLWRDHAPAKVDQRKAALEQYLRSLIALPVKNKDEVIAFFTSDIVREAAKPVSQAGYKEGYLTKRGKNFGGWKTRYFVLNGPTLEYYESRGGTHLGSITITGAQIGRQQRTAEKREGDEDNEYRHAFLIIEAKRAPGGPTARHVLCAESDEERDSWVEELVRYVTGTYNDEQGPVPNNIGGPSPVSMSSAAQSAQPRSSTSSNPPTELQTTPTRRSTKEIVIAKGPAMPISQLAPDSSNAKLFNATSYSDMPSNSPAKSIAPSVAERLEGDVPLSSSLPVSSPLVEEPETSIALGQRANSELGHYPDLVDQRAAASRSPEQMKRNKDKRRSMKPMKTPSIPERSERSSSPEKDATPNTPRVDAHGKVKISGPMNGTPIPAGYKFGKDAPPPEQPPMPTSTRDRAEKTKSRTAFKGWGFGRTHDKAAAAVPALAPRPVFGVSLEDSLDVAQIASLPAIVFRCIQYLEVKKAEQEEGIYRLSGSTAVIKSLKDRFNAEGDVDLLASDEYWDPHAIAGLLKTFLRELPASILTRDLHLRFLSVIDFVDPQERVRELSHLISSLPVANYSLLRALTAHLILIVQNANINKMTMRNVGIVFSPTLGIPAGVFSLMLGEFKRVFNVDGTLEESAPPADVEDAQAQTSARRNSQHYSEAAADQMLGLAGRVLPVQQEEGQSDADDGEDVVEESGTEATTENDSESVVESSAASSSAHANVYVERAQTPPEYTQDGQSAAERRSRASQLAASRGLSVATDKASRRHSRMIGLPHSPRPPPHGPPPPHNLQPSGLASSQGPSSSPHTGDSLGPIPASPAVQVSPQRPT